MTYCDVRHVFDLLISRVWTLLIHHFFMVKDAKGQHIMCHTCYMRNTFNVYSAKFT